MRLYRIPGSPNCLKVELVLAHLGLEHERVDVDPSRRQELNPAGKVPVLADHDMVLWESGAILIHIAESHPEGQLAGSDRREQSEVLRWLFFEAAQIAPASNLVKAHSDVLPPAERVPQVAEAARGLLARFVPVYDGRLREVDYLAGRLTVADFAALPFLHLFEQAGVLSGLDGIGAWLQRMRELPAWQVAARSWNSPIAVARRYCHA